MSLFLLQYWAEFNQTWTPWHDDSKHQNDHHFGLLPNIPKVFFIGTHHSSWTIDQDLIKFRYNDHVIDHQRHIFHFMSNNLDRLLNALCQ